MRRINEIIQGKRGITADTALRLRTHEEITCSKARRPVSSFTRSSVGTRVSIRYRLFSNGSLAATLEPYLTSG
jgi:hypothetical protein